MADQVKNEGDLLLEVDIPMFVYEFLHYIDNENYEDCAILRDYLYGIYDTIEDVDKSVFKEFITDFIEEEELTKEKELVELVDSLDSR